MSRREWPLLFAIFLDLVGFGMAFPDIQLRAEQFGQEQGVREPILGMMIGLVLASYFGAQILASPRWGVLSDRIGRKPVLIICTAFSALSMLVYAFAGSIWIILLSRVFAGLAAANVVVGQAYIADVTPEKGRAAAMGRVGAAISAGLIVGPAVGGFLAHLGGNYLMGLVAASASTLSLLWIWLGVPGHKPTEERRPGKNPVIDLRLLKEFPSLKGFIGVIAVSWFALACLEGTFGRLIKSKLGYGQQEFGIIFSYEALLGVVVSGLLLGWITRRFPNERGLLRWGFLVQGLGLGLMPFAKEIAGDWSSLPIPGPFMYLLLTSTVYGLGIAITGPMINSICSHLTPDNRQGELFGLMQATRSIGFLLGPILGGILFDIVHESPYLLAGLVCVLALIILPDPVKARANPSPDPA
ncbi:MAG: MFS transporter [Fimbriimonadaceae bacterium]|nr:MFS transporter [Fimbriimonadaceae bacterium]